MFQPTRVDLRKVQFACKLFAGRGYFTEMCSGSKVGSYLRLIDCVHRSILGLRVIKKKKVTVAPEDLLHHARDRLHDEQVPVPAGG